jgi:hypothetical protein
MGYMMVLTSSHKMQKTCTIKSKMKTRATPDDGRLRQPRRCTRVLINQFAEVAEVIDERFQRRHTMLGSVIP